VAPATVIYDANVLYPAPLRDFLIRLAMSGVVRARWTDAIHDEWIRNLLQNRPDITAQQLARTRELMNRAVPDCLVSGYEQLIGKLQSPNPKDRHVLAAAIHAKANVIITLNIRHFPKAVLAPLGIRAQSPDDFVTDLFGDHAEEIHLVAQTQRSALTSPAQSVEEFLDTLSSVGLPRIAALLGLRRGEL
jgi:predicted nucleic acid-binding protein